jgi:Sec-independent protein translocase protein TatA
MFYNHIWRFAMKKMMLSVIAVMCLFGASSLSFAEEMGKMKGEMKGEMKAKHDEMKGEMKGMKDMKDEMKGEMKGAMGK